MNQGLLRGQGRRPKKRLDRRGLVIAKGRSSATATGISATTVGTGTDIPGLPIDFEVLNGEEVEVELGAIFLYHSTAGGSIGIAITDLANNIYVEDFPTSGSANQVMNTTISALFSTPGKYSCKAVVWKAAAAGTVAFGTADSHFQHRLKATVQ